MGVMEERCMTLGDVLNKLEYWNRHGFSLCYVIALSEDTSSFNYVIRWESDEVQQ